jgi:NADH dehydrogenase
VARHAVVPVRASPQARLLLGRATTVDMSPHRHRAAGRGQRARRGVRLVVALGAIARTAPVPGRVEHAVGFKTIAEAIHLRNHVLQQLELAATIDDPRERERRLTFVFVGGGYAGVEAMAELEDLVRDASRYYPTLRDVPRRWLLADAADHVLNDLRGRLVHPGRIQLNRPSERHD